MGRETPARLYPTPREVRVGEKKTSQRLVRAQAGVRDLTPRVLEPIGDG